MILLDFIFLGWYQILDKTIYASKPRDSGIGPREHSFFISYLLHGINVYTGLRYYLIERKGQVVELPLALSIAVIIFLLGYVLFLRSGRGDKVIRNGMGDLQVIFALLFTLAYTAVTVYLMLEVGDYVRSILHPELM